MDAADPVLPNDISPKHLDLVGHLLHYAEHGGRVPSHVLRDAAAVIVDQRASLAVRQGVAIGGNDDAPGYMHPSASGPICTGKEATWCPVHGDCTCPSMTFDPDDERTLDDESCPLHRSDGRHAAREATK